MLDEIHPLCTRPSVHVHVQVLGWLEEEVGESFGGHCRKNAISCPNGFTQVLEDEKL